MSDSSDPKPPADDMATAGLPDAPPLADVVEFAREPFADAPAKPAAQPPQPVTSPPPAPPNPAPQQPAPQQSAPPQPQKPAQAIQTPPARPASPQPQPTPPPRPQPTPSPAATAVVPSAVEVAPEPPRVKTVPAPGAWREPTGGQFQLLAYLRANARRVVWMIVVPILAAELALGLFALGPQEHRASATVNIPTEGSSVSDVTQSVAEFRSLVTSDSVARQVNAQTQVSVGKIKSGLSSKRKGTSSLVDVTFTSSKKATVLPVVRAVSREALAALIEPEVEVADRALKKSEDDFADVQQKIIEFNAAHGLLLDPPETYRAKVAELGRLKVQAQQAHAPGGNAQRAASLDAAVAQAQKDVENLAAIVRDYQRLQTEHDQLQSTINASANRLSDARARIDAANASSTIDVGGVKKVNALAKTARAAAITFVVGLLLMVGLLVMLEVLGYGTSARVTGASAPPAVEPASSSRKPARNSPKKRRR